ncbi:MauE/DoxX family redox-associated membrane protein [Enhygromyxa salina]|uniref:MauE/DoxX family redox-associated membrane protein n=1 Tax=Enhygromyxa salina TaxID=215803 RepID=UPI000696FF37|nr:MauE/DoxX family redox-associated membrane protein [Enhygromyxa salina]
MSASTPTPKWMLAASWAGRLIAGGVFIYAAALKLVDPVAFAQDIANYQAFPYWTWNLAAAVVPVVELLGGLALIIGFKRRAGSVVLGALTLAFIGLILSVIVRGIDLSCGCFGEATQSSAVGWPMLLRDVALLVAIVAAYLPPEGPPKGPPNPSDSSPKRLLK